MAVVLTDNVRDLFFEFRSLSRPFKNRKRENQLFSLRMATESIFIYCDLIARRCLWLVFTVRQAVALFQSAAVLFFFQVGT